MVEFCIYADSNRSTGVGAYAMLLVENFLEFVKILYAYRSSSYRVKYASLAKAASLSAVELRSATNPIHDRWAITLAA